MRPEWPALALAALGLGLVVLLARPLAATAERLTTIPWQFYRIAINPRLRRNHALEHATLNVLAQRHGRLQLVGAAADRGFVLRGIVNPWEIELSARDGLQRLKAGEHGLAFHPHCGTSLATAEILTWAVLIGGLATAGRLTVPWALVAIGLTWLLAPSAGWLIQRLLTTSLDVGCLSVAGLAYRAASAPSATPPPAGGAGWFAGEVIVFVDAGRPAPRVERRRS